MTVKVLGLFCKAYLLKCKYVFKHCGSIVSDASFSRNEDWPRQMSFHYHFTFHNLLNSMYFLMLHRITFFSDLSINWREDGWGEVFYCCFFSTNNNYCSLIKSNSQVGTCMSVAVCNPL